MYLQEFENKFSIGIECDTAEKMNTLIRMLSLGNKNEITMYTYFPTAQVGTLHIDVMKDEK
jgi:hypothetical protein